MGRLAKLEVRDPDGDQWFVESSIRWEEAVREAKRLGPAVSPLEVFEPVPLPAFGGRRSPHVTREVLGRFLEDRDSRTVHDVYAATPDCALDSIPNATYYHFWREVIAIAGESEPCAHCLGS